MSEVVELLRALEYEENEPDLDVPGDFTISVEEQLGVTLPSDYRQFLGAFPRTGGPGVSVLIEPLDESGGEAVSWMELAGFEGDDDSGLLGKNTHYPDLAIANTIVIGDDIMGNLLYMSVHPETAGAVYFYDRVQPFEGTLDSLVQLSNSFLHFLQRTTIDPDD